MGSVKTILLTGGTGFLGSHVLSGLIEHGYRPVVLLRNTSSTWRIDNLLNFCTPYLINYITETSIGQLFQKHQFDAIIHTAIDYGRASPLSALLQTNIIFPILLIEAGLKTNLKLFINTDTFSAKKQFNQLYLNEYHSSKRILEGLIRDLGSRASIANLRLEHVYGENDAEAKFVTSVYKQLIQNQPVIQFTEGTQKRDMIYVKDVVSAFIKIIEHAEKIIGFEEFEVGTGNSVSIKYFVERMATLLYSKSKLDFGALQNRVGQIENSFADISKLAMFGWAPVYTLEAAIEKMDFTDKKRFK